MRGIYKKLNLSGYDSAELQYFENAGKQAERLGTFDNKSTAIVQL
jgi:hypothetical protein